MRPILDQQNAFTELFDLQGQLLGAVLGPEAWALVRQTVLEHFAPAAQENQPKEPLADWQLLKESWDFKYPVDLDVVCTLCGNSTENWEADEPRRFRLTAANFGGLVTFQCQGCKAKIMKRHFKDYIKVEAFPFLDAKNTKKEGRT